MPKTKFFTDMGSGRMVMQPLRAKVDRSAAAEVHFCRYFRYVLAL